MTTGFPGTPSMREYRRWILKADTQTKHTDTTLQDVFENGYIELDFDWLLEKMVLVKCFSEGGNIDSIHRCVLWQEPSSEST